MDINGTMNLAAQQITVGGNCLPDSIAFGTDGFFYGCIKEGGVTDTSDVSYSGKWRKMSIQ